MAVGRELRVELGGVHPVEEAVDLAAHHELDDPVASRVLGPEVGGVVGVDAEDDVLVCELVEAPSARNLGAEEPLRLRIADLRLELWEHGLDEDIGDNAANFPANQCFRHFWNPQPKVDVDKLIEDGETVPKESMGCS